MTTIKSLSLVIAVALLFMSCKHGFKKLDPRVQVIFKTDKGDFRGFDFGTTIDVVFKSEQEQQLEDFPDYLLYKINSSAFAEGEYVEVDYMFNKNGLLDMTSAYYMLNDTATIQPLIKEIKQYFVRKYGRPTKDEWGWYLWEVNDEKNQTGLLEITLSAEYDNDEPAIALEMVKYFE